MRSPSSACSRGEVVRGVIGESPGNDAVAGGGCGFRGRTELRSHEEVGVVERGVEELRLLNSGSWLVSLTSVGVTGVVRRLPGSLRGGVLGASAVVTLPSGKDSGGDEGSGRDEEGEGDRLVSFWEAGIAV